MYANASVEIKMGEKHNDLTEIIAHALNEMKKENGEKFNPDKVNLAELERSTGVSRSKLRRIKKSGFIDLPHALTDRKAEHTLLTGFSGINDELLRKGITNSAVCYDKLKENGFQMFQVIRSHIIYRQGKLQLLLFEDSVNHFFNSSQYFFLPQKTTVVKFRISIERTKQNNISKNASRYV